MDSAERYRTRQRRLITSAVVLGFVILGVGYHVLKPHLTASPPEKPEDVTVQVPAYDYGAWHRWPVQVDGRTKPFETACREAVRSITGKTRFEGHDPVALVLMWMFTNGAGEGTTFPDWENYPFILCDHQELRKWVFAHRAAPEGSGKLEPEDIDAQLLARAGDVLSDEQLHGKYVRPADLRDSPGFKRLLAEADRIRREDRDKAMQYLSPEQKKAGEVWRRLSHYDMLSRNDHVDAGRIPADDQEVNLVQLDRVPGSPWLSLPDIDRIQQDPAAWVQLISERMTQTPQLYIPPENLAELQRFQDLVEKGEALPVVDELQKQRLEELGKRLDEEVERLHAQGKYPLDELRRRKEAVLEERRQVFDEMRNRVKRALNEGYDRHDPKWRMLHLDYLEMRYPELYRDAVVWQEFPAEKARQVEAAWEKVRDAYREGAPVLLAGPGADDPGRAEEARERFAAASEEFFRTAHRVSDDILAEGLGLRPNEAVRQAYAAYKEKLAAAESEEAKDRARDEFFAVAAAADPDALRYPGSSTIDLELTFNRTQPFMWAWILMLPAVIAFTASYVSGSRVLYGAGFTFFGLSLLFQLFGFYCRIAISGRAPVSNMYETVIFVAFMSAVFAMILELVYRKGVIAIAGSLVATIALVLADQLPLALDPKISPLVPVLRSNFWLVIHVLTITASYAGGTLAWGLANVSLALLVFGNPTKETLKTLSTFTYRAMQIAVLLLAAGTFLGGWWAAYSWGRFWGWDPKETWALISLVCYVIPLHARYIGWVKDFGLAVSAILCYAAILMCWYGVNFVLGAGLHSYGFGGGGPYWVLLAGLLNIQWVLIASILYLRKTEGRRLRQAEEAAAEVQVS